MNRQTRTISAACLAAMVAASIYSPAMAFPPPIGAVSGAKKVQEGMGAGKDDLTFSPLLLELAKLIGRTGLPQGFFLENDSAFPDEPGVDLRTLLLYQAGLIKMPIRMITGHKATPKPTPLPTLTIPTIPETTNEIGDGSTRARNADMPSLASEPLPRDPDSAQVVEPKANVGEPEKISLAGAGRRASRPANAPMLSFDVTRLQEDLNNQEKDDAAKAQVHADMPRLAMLMPRTNTMPFITKNSFRLWTYHPNARGLELNGVERIDGAATAFNGTFVVATPGAIKSITGRHFEMSSGRLLTSNQGGELLFNTDLADVSIEPEATAVIELSNNNGARTLRIFALEAVGGRSVNVTLHGAQKDKNFKLDKGEALIIGDHALTENDFAGSHLSSKNRVEQRIARGSFPLGQFVDQDLMLKSENVPGNSPTERTATLSELKTRVERQP